MEGKRIKEDLHIREEAKGRPTHYTFGLLRQKVDIILEKFMKISEIQTDFVKHL